MRVISQHDETNLDKATPAPCDTPLPQTSTKTDRLQDYLRASSATATLKAYKSDLEHFVNWGGCIPCSADVIANYLVHFAGELATSTLVRRVAALSKVHQVAGHDNPTRSELVRSAMKGIKRLHGTSPHQVAPITKERLIAMLDTCEGNTKGIRDRALLLVGFSSALRRSEVVALNCKNLEWVPEGLIITITRSKTDQQGEGRRIGIPYGKSQNCPVKALEHYMDMHNLTDGPLFRPLGEVGLGCDRLSAHGVAYIIKSRAKLAGLDPTKFSGHSLRAGFATSAAQAGAETWAIMKQTGHRSETTVRKYIREGELFKNNVVSSLL